jgi:hypothetical protein
MAKAERSRNHLLIGILDILKPASPSSRSGGTRPSPCTVRHQPDRGPRIRPSNLRQFRLTWTWAVRRRSLREAPDHMVHPTAYRSSSSCFSLPFIGVGHQTENARNDVGRCPRAVASVRVMSGMAGDSGLLLNADQVARRVAEGAVAHSPRLRGGLLKDLGARCTDLLEGCVKVIGAEDRGLQGPLRHE